MGDSELIHPQKSKYGIETDSNEQPRQFGGAD